MPEPGKPLRVVFWGTYDTGKPRTRILLRGLRELGVELLECHTDVWSAVEDKSRIDSRLQQFKLLFACLASYPGLLWRYLRLPPHDVLILGYPGQLDILLLWPLARLRKTPIVLDLVQSVYLAMVELRDRLPKAGLAARLLFRIERFALRAADRVVFLSRYGAADLGSRFGIPECKRAAVMIGVEPEIFSTSHRDPGSSGRKAFHRFVLRQLPQTARHRHYRCGCRACSLATVSLGIDRPGPGSAGHPTKAAGFPESPSAMDSVGPLSAAGAMASSG